MDAGIPPEHSATEVLRKLGGLDVGVSGTGLECATSRLSFSSFDADEDIAAWSDLLGVILVAVARTDDGYCELYIADDDRCFLLETAGGAFFYLADSFLEAVEALLLGRRARPLLRPGATAATAYGEEISADDPRLYRF